MDFSLLPKLHYNLHRHKTSHLYVACAGRSFCNKSALVTFMYLTVLFLYICNIYIRPDFRGNELFALYCSIISKSSAMFVKFVSMHLLVCATVIIKWIILYSLGMRSIGKLNNMYMSFMLKGLGHNDN